MTAAGPAPHGGPVRRPRATPRRGGPRPDAGVGGRGAPPGARGDVVQPEDSGGHFMDQFTYAERATDWRGNN
ncbi:hypothetical protein, partial [Micromonospora carbonacea]|uniref:hypothetical protein n=1 Tax=Micromonospora carbonacea TaxID=47853 RepID=UPI0033DA2B48